MLYNVLFGGVHYSRIDSLIIRNDSYRLRDRIHV